MIASRIFSRRGAGVMLAVAGWVVIGGASAASAGLAGGVPIVVSADVAVAQSSSGAQRPAMDSPRSTIETVGPLFSAGLTSDHTCTASVVDSPAGDVIVTAAHCISGSGAGVVFAPGYDDGLAPYGTWVVQRAYAAPGWTIGRDPDADYIFLIVTPATTNRTSASVQAVVGGNVLGGSPTAGQQVTVAGYVSGHDDVPVICTASIYLTASYPSFDCPGYAGGTSSVSPLI